MREVRRVLVVSPNWLGDAVMALPAIADIRRRYRGAHLSVAARRSVADLFALVPGVDAVVPLDWRGRLFDRATRREDQRRLRAIGADLAVLFPNSFASAWLTYRAAIRTRWGYPTDLRGMLLTEAVETPGGSVHQVEYYQHLVRGFGIETGGQEPVLQVPGDVRDAMARRLANGGWRPPQPLVVLAPGAAYGQAKRWLPEHFAAVANTLVRDHEAHCVLVGSGADASTTAVIRQHLSPGATDRVVDLAGATTIPELAAVMHHGRVCVTNDSGALHIAAAAGTPVVALFGPTREHETAPSTTLRRTVEVLVNPVSCRPCMLRECPIDHRCMRGLLPARVLTAVVPVLTRPGGAAAVTTERTGDGVAQGDTR